MADFTVALGEVEPSGLREFSVEVPNVRWEDVGGLSEIKAALQEAIAWPLSEPALFERAGVRPPRGSAVRPTGQWQDADSQGPCVSKQPQLHQRKGPGTALEMM